MERNGWIRLHRGIENHWIWETPKYFARWVDMLFLASWDTKTVLFNNRAVTVARGQFVTSSRMLQGRWKTNAKTVRVFLDTLEQDGMIRTATSKYMTIVSICNYDKYQTPQNPNENPAENTTFSEQGGKREGKHLINNINNINNISHAKTRTREEEEKLFEELKASATFRESCSAALGCAPETIDRLLGKFAGLMGAEERIHEDDADARSHFLKWAKIQIDLTQRNNGTKNGTGGDAAKDRYAKRRGTEPSDPRKKDYGGGF